MGDRTTIEWTQATWNPVRGCSRVSEGCRNCYAERIAGRFSKEGQPFHGFAQRGARTGWHAKWTGKVALVPEHLADPLRWKKPRRVFVNSMSDLFHEGLSNEDIAAVFGVMAAAPQHTFQVLTKRPERMLAWFRGGDDGSDKDFDICGATCAALDRAGFERGCGSAFDPEDWPLPNVWLGVSVEDQTTADERIPLLLQTPAAVRFVSYEPALGPVSFFRWMTPTLPMWADGRVAAGDGPRLDWIIAGSESGPRARPAELEWFRQTRDQCAAAGVSFFFKQWVGESTGQHAQPDDATISGVRRKVSLPVLDGRQHAEFPR